LRTDLAAINIAGTNLIGSMPDGVCPDIDFCLSIECSCCLCTDEVVGDPSPPPSIVNETLSTSESYTPSSSPSQRESSKSTVGGGTLAAVSGAVSSH